MAHGLECGCPNSAGDRPRRSREYAHHRHTQHHNGAHPAVSRRVCHAFISQFKFPTGERKHDFMLRCGRASTVDRDLERRRCHQFGSHSPDRLKCPRRAHRDRSSEQRNIAASKRVPQFSCFGLLHHLDQRLAINQPA